jgi:AraC-like DNA-binding protein
MPFRIFGTVLGNHSWSADGRLCIVQQRESASFEKASPEAEIDALFSRLLHRSRWERAIYRAAMCLRDNPSIPLDQLAAELCVSERYLLSGFRSALSVDPHDFLQKIKVR